MRVIFKLGIPPKLTNSILIKLGDSGRTRTYTEGQDVEYLDAFEQSKVKKSSIVTANLSMWGLRKTYWEKSHQDLKYEYSYKSLSGKGTHPGSGSVT